jgi:hypothetical protein
MKLFTVHDSKAELFLNPMTFRNAGDALRAFETTVNDPQSQFHKFPDDFTLVEIASYDQDCGIIKPHDAHVILANASTFINKD